MSTDIAGFHPTRPATARDDGFTLLELLVVVMILGVLAAISIPALTDMRERAWRAELISDVRHVALDIESVATIGGSYPLDWSTVMAAGSGVDVSAAAATSWTYADNGSSFCLAAVHPSLGSGGVAVYDGAAGGMQPLVDGDLDPTDNC